MDRSGQLVECGPTAMEEAIISRGGRVPDTVTLGSADAAAATLAGSNNIISASYIAATTNMQRQRLAGGGAAAAPSVASSSATSRSGWWASAVGGGVSGGSHDGRYTYMDEVTNGRAAVCPMLFPLIRVSCLQEYLRCLQTHVQWERDNGIIHLMPIAVVYQEDVS